MKLKLDIYIKDNGQIMQWTCDTWRVTETGQLIIERIIEDVGPFKAVIPPGEWAYLREHPNE